MSKQDFLKVMGQAYALGIQYGKTEEEMLALAKELKDKMKKQ